MSHDAEAAGLIDRRLTPVLDEAMATARVVALLGPRQAGKTTLARWYAERQRTPSSYVTLDDKPVRDAAHADPVGFVSQLQPGSVIDEIQRAPELLLAVKSRVDRDSAPGQLLITGSANLRRIPAVEDALPGRVDYLTLWPFTQGEISRGREDFLERVFSNDVPMIEDGPIGRDHYSDLILRGGFPEAQLRKGVARGRFFESYVGSIVDRDVGDVAAVRDPGSVGTVLRLIAARSGALTRFETLGRDASLDGKTVKSHLEILERLFLVRVRKPWHVNIGKRQAKASKSYISDTGLLAALIGADEARLRTDGAVAGSLFETFVVTELERQAAWSPIPVTCWHYRDGEHEVDAIVERPSGEIVGVEVKAGATVRTADFKGLVRLRDAVGPRFRSGVVVYAGERTLPFGDRLWAMPMTGLWSA